MQKRHFFPFPCHVNCKTLACVSFAALEATSVAGYSKFQMAKTMVKVYFAWLYITFSTWGGMHGYPASVHCRGVWGHAPPGSFGNFRCSEVHSGAF